MLPLDASVLSGASPVQGRSGLASFRLQVRDLATEDLISTLPKEKSQLVKQLLKVFTEQLGFSRSGSILEPQFQLLTSGRMIQGNAQPVLVARPRPHQFE